MKDNHASSSHPVVQEIVRRQRNSIKGNSDTVAKEGTKLGLVVEGGAMMGIYSGGVLMTLEEMGCSSVFDIVYGESGGAINASYFLSKQGALGIRIYMEDMTSLKFVNPFRLGKILDLDYAIDVVVKSRKPLDPSRVMLSPSDFYVPVTDALTGASRMVDVKRDGIPLLPLLKASAAIVPLYNHAVCLNGRSYVDGGIACPVPVRAAIDDGCTHILVLLTQPEDHRAEPFSGFERLAMLSAMGKWSSALVESVYERRKTRYNASRDIALGRTMVKAGVSIASISPSTNSPRLGKATLSKGRLAAALADSESRTREVFRELACD